MKKASDIIWNIFLIVLFVLNIIFCLQTMSNNIMNMFAAILVSFSLGIKLGVYVNEKK